MSYLEIPFMNKRLIVACTLLGMLMGWVAILFWPRTYESQAKLMVRVGRESVALDPTATTSSTLILQKTQDEEIISALEVLDSRRIAEVVVDELGTEAILDGKLPESTNDVTAHEPSLLNSWKNKATDAVQNVLLKAGIKDDISNRELAVRKLQTSVSSSSSLKSSVISIEGRSTSPQMAQLIVDTVTRTFLNEHLEGARTKGSFEFFEQQSAAVENQLNELIQARSDFMKTHGIVSIEGSRTMLQEQISNVERDLLVSLGQLKQVTSEIEDLKSKLLSTDEEIVAAKIAGTDSTWSGMRQQVYALELLEQDLAATHTDESPKLKRVREQLRGAQAILAKLNSDRVDENMSPNPIKTGLSQELQQQQTKVVGLKSVIEHQQKKRDEMRQRADDLLEQERHLTQTDRDIRLMEGSLKTLREKLEEARVIDQLQLKKISNVHVFQPATFEERATSPQKKILAAGFLLLGLTTGLGLSLLNHISSPLVRTVEDVQCRLGHRVLSSIPRFLRMKVARSKQKMNREYQSLVSEILLTRPLHDLTKGRSIGIIGVDSGAGASTLAVNLAVTSSSDCRMKTVLVDADTRGRSISRMFGLNGKPGLVELVGGSASHDECLQNAKNSSIEIIASAADTCDELLSARAPEIAQALQAYLQDCDLLIVDLPAASQPDQSVALAQHLDCVLVVIESEKTEAASADRLLRRLAESNTVVVGVVLNKTRNYMPKPLRRFVDPLV